MTLAAPSALAILLDLRQFRAHSERFASRDPQLIDISENVDMIWIERRLSPASLSRHLRTI